MQFATLYLVVDDLDFEEGKDTTLQGSLSQTLDSDPPPIVDFDGAELDPFDDDQERMCSIHLHHGLLCKASVTCTLSHYPSINVPY